MTRTILVAAPSSWSRPLAVALPEGFAVRLCVDRDLARALMRVADFHALLTVEGFLDDLAHPTKIVVPEDALLNPAAVARWAETAIALGHQHDRRRAQELVSISSVPYGEYTDLVRYRSSREYLLGLVERFRGNVSDASRAAGMARESLHRLLRRYDIEPERFREPHSTDADAPRETN